MKETFMNMVKKNEMPVSQEYMINLALLDMKEAEEKKEWFEQFDKSSIETTEERIHKMKRICAKYNLPMDLFEKHREASAKDAFDSFMTSTGTPYYYYKAYGGIDSTLIKSKYMEHPRHKIQREKKEGYFEEMYRDKKIAEQQRLVVEKRRAERAEKRA